MYNISIFQTYVLFSLQKNNWLLQKCYNSSIKASDVVVSLKVPRLLFARDFFDIQRLQVWYASECKALIDGEKEKVWKPALVSKAS